MAKFKPKLSTVASGSFSLPSSGGSGYSLLVMRVVVGAMMLYFHGLPLLQNARSVGINVPDVLHIGKRATVILLLVSQIVGAILLMVGLATRFAAALLIFTTAVFVVPWRQPFDRTFELSILYILCFVMLAQMGGGSMSLDKKLR